MRKLGRIMSFGSKKAGILGQRGGQLVAERDSLFETNWDELVIRFDRKTKEYRVVTALQNGVEEPGEFADEVLAETAKAAASDV